MANKLSLTHKQAKDFALCQVHAIYMQSMDESAMPQLIDMSHMFATKYLNDGYLEGSMQDHTTSSGETIKVPPQFFVQLMFQIMIQKYNKSHDAEKFA